LVGALAKVSGQYTSTGVLLLFQNLICLLFIAPVALRGGWSSLRSHVMGLHVLRATTGTACWYALFFAITQIPLANATLLTYSAPLWMPLVAWTVSRQRAQPQSHGFSLGELSALAGAIFLAVAMMSVRWLGATEPSTESSSTTSCSPPRCPFPSPYSIGSRCPGRPGVG
jgi:drug/metabolite transporter (DMT)-like permease